MEISSDRLTQLALAQDSTTDEWTLVELSTIPDEGILCAVASNPNTSPSTLAQLQADPPIFFEYEDPDGTEFDALFRCIAANPNTPAYVLVSLSANSSTCYELAKNPNTPVDILNQLANWNNYQMWRSLLGNPALPISALERLASVESQDIRQEVLTHPNVSTDAIAIVDFMEGNHNVPTHIFKRLALDNRLHVLIALAKCHEIPSSILDKIAEATSIEIYKLVEIHKIVVTNPSATSKLLEKIAPKLVEQYNQKYWSMGPPTQLYTALLATLSHANATRNVFDSISYACLKIHGEWRSDLYLKIAENSLTLSSTLERLIQKINPGNNNVFIALANNPNTPSECLQFKILELLKTPYPNWAEVNSFQVIQELLKSSNLYSDFLKELFNLKKIFNQKAQNFYIPDYILDIYINLASNPNTPPECLQLKIRELVKASHIEENGFNHSINAINRLLRSPNVSAQILEELFDDNHISNDSLKAYIRTHPNCPRHLLNR
jgi:hypothetical protein